MSGVIVIRHILVNNVSVLAHVPATRIMAGVLPINIGMPAISIRQVNGTEFDTIGMSGAKILATDTVDVEVFAKTYSDQKILLNLVRKACQNVHGNVNGIEVDSIVPAAAGPDQFDPDVMMYTQARGFIVKYATARQ